MHLIVPYRRSGGPDFFPIRRGPKRGNLRHIPGSDVNLNAAPPRLCAAFHRPTEPDRQPRPANGSFLAADRPHSSEVRSILLPIRALPRRLTLLVGVVRMFVRRDLRRSADEDRLEKIVERDFGESEWVVRGTRITMRPTGHRDAGLKAPERLGGIARRNSAGEETARAVAVCVVATSRDSQPA